MGEIRLLYLNNHFSGIIMLKKLIMKTDLSFDESYELINMIERDNDVRVSAYLTALQTKGFTSTELAGFISAIRDKSVRVDVHKEKMDTCGTGGDGVGTVNASTASAIISSLFIPVAKHGNRSITSICGSADVIEELGISFSSDPLKAKEMLEKVNFAFLLAPAFNPIMARVMPIRRSLSIETVFNILGPLINPAIPEYQIIGVYNPRLCKTIAEALSMVGIKRALVVHGSGIDEVALHGPTLVYEVNDKKIESYSVEPEEIGFKRCDLKELLICDKKTSSKKILDVFYGKKGSIRDFIVLNSSFALYSSKKAKNFVDAKEMVENSIDDGKISERLEEIRSYSSKFVELKQSQN
ncbi:anthranilate phosphoribosyltransferase [Candidatus Methanoliparum sp. LAM-1]|nr:anthranilate phosphoribosyltransferase [Candidatus Methanoliparum sp. LAM-1]